MTDSSLRAQATQLGIPTQVAITDDIRHQSCDARMAGLASIEGKTAIYKGHFANGHHYTIRRVIKERNATVIRKMQIVDGRLTLGDDKNESTPTLQEY